MTVGEISIPPSAAAETPHSALGTTHSPRTWPRLLLVELLQLPPLGLALVGEWPWALWTAALIGSAICSAGTDSGWRWRNRLLLAQAILWLTAAALFA